MMHINGLIIQQIKIAFNQNVCPTKATLFRNLRIIEALHGPDRA